MIQEKQGIRDLTAELSKIAYHFLSRTGAPYARIAGAVPWFASDEKNKGM